MKAVWYTRQGAAADVLQYGEQPEPTPGAGELLIRLRASGVNPADCNRRRGPDYPITDPLVIPNSDGAGDVIAQGPATEPGWTGKRVWLYNGQRGRALGTAAQYIALDQSLVTELPADVPYEIGACLGIPAMTAWCCVFDDGECDLAGQSVLVTGGAGAVGRYAVQFARAAGARVITTVSGAAKAAHAARAAPDLIINYRSDDVVAAVRQATAGHGVERIVDVDFGGNLATSLQVLKPNGVIAAYASRGDTAPRLAFYDLMRKCATVRAVMLPALPLAQRRNAQAGVARWLTRPEVTRVHAVAARVPLADTVRAHELVEAGDKLGTVIVDIA
jgi:NADPH2:quinone reductase